MTETHTGPTSPEDIDDEVSPEQSRLDREADAILLEGEARAFGPRPIHEAVREDALAAREWSRVRAERLRHAVEDEPIKATLYALGLGLVIGLLIAR
ncbi:hypothetical protein [Brevundimonas sp.]|uniref:hypothetical protein n=1 Tax=Brevundimonas sp. TaxID=1871086 RepID=UPI002D454068|nr:hypothetical protein [Brevundimonas sp.]HYC75217.1 hypothetical protein [Brevundimonas sp.]